VNVLNTAKTKHLRGTVLLLLRTNHDDQKSRFDSTALWSALVRGLSFDVSRNELKTVLQDLKGRGYIDFKQQKDLDSGTVYIVQIELCPRGRDLLEGTIEDAAVEI
jgi:hypothetical protein